MAAVIVFSSYADFQCLHSELFFLVVTFSLIDGCFALL